MKCSRSLSFVRLLAIGLVATEKRESAVSRPATTRGKIAQLILGVFVLINATLGQSSVRVDASYPFSSPFSVAPVTVQVSGGADQQAVAVGVGSGVLMMSGIDGANPAPHLFHPGTSGGNPDGITLRTLGRIRRQRMLDNSLWVASGRRGAMRFDLSATPEANPPPFDATYSDLGGDVWGLAVLSSQTDRRIFAGTIEDNGQGKLWMIDPVAGTRTSVTINTGIECVEAYAYTPASGSVKFRVIVGTRCAGLQLFEIDAPYTQLPSSPTSTAGGSGAYVRDLALHIIDGQTQRIYAAMHRLNNSTIHGVYGYRIDASGSLAQYAHNGWPIRPFDGAESVLTDRLALDPSNSRLVIGLGTTLEAAVNYSGPCDRPLTCNCTTYPCEPADTKGGVAVYTIGAEPSATVSPLEVAFDFAPVQQPPPPAEPIDDVRVACRDIAIRPIDASSYWIDIAADTSGYQLLRAAKAVGQPWSFEAPFHYSSEEGLPLQSWDTLRISNGFLYVGTETGLATIDPDLPVPGSSTPGALTNVLQPAEGDALEEYLDYDSVGDALAAADGGVLGLSGKDGRLYAASNGGVRIFDVTGSKASNPVMVNKVLKTQGKAFFCEVTDALACNPISNANDRFLYVSHVRDDIPPKSGSGSVALYNVGTFGGYAPRGDPNASCPQIARYIHDQNSPNPKASLGGLAVINTTNQGEPFQYVLVAYGPKEGGESHVGLVVLQTHCFADGWLMEYDTKVQASSGGTPCVACFNPGLVTYDPTSPGHPRAYVAFFCNGFAVYDVSNPAAPVLENWRPPTPNSDESFFQVLRGSEHLGATRLVVSSLKRGLGVVSDLTASGLPIVFHTLPVVAGQIQYADETKNSFWVAGFRDGMVRATLLFQ